MVLSFGAAINRDRFSPGYAHAIAAAFQDRSLVVVIQQQIEVSPSAGIEPVYNSGQRIDVVL